ncbi:MAG: (2Fe-2S)-binding protein [Myxococcota bacterium]|nr:(2Fe-2S)-binding protein [Myxococcota bacterium]
MPILKVNGIEHSIDAPVDVPLLWILREELGLTGTKYSCGKSLCGSCTIHINGKARRSCVTPVSAALDQEVTTIEGILGDDGEPHAIQRIWAEENVPQCGYCQSGQIMSALALIQNKKNVTDADIDAVMSANICRCGSYLRIRKAIRRTASLLTKQKKEHQ